jgi:hypothetical protein
MTFTTTTLKALRALGLGDEMNDKILAIFEEARESKPKKKGDSADRQARGTRLADDWVLPTEYSEAAMRMGLRANEITREAVKFKNYWVNQPGQKGVKLRWGQTWDNWCMSTLERAGRQPILACAASSGSGGPSGEGPETFTDATWRAIAKRYKATGQWNSAGWGPPPGRMDCKMPDAYL